MRTHAAAATRSSVLGADDDRNLQSATLPKEKEDGMD